MADTPRGTTRSNWWILVLVVAAVIAGLAWWAANRETGAIGGSIATPATDDAVPA